MCGCGGLAPIATRKVTSKGYVKDQPVRFIAGHNMHTAAVKAIPEPNPSGLCICGCGQKTEVAKQSHTGFGYVKGKPVRFIQGHGGNDNFVDRAGQRYTRLQVLKYGGLSKHTQTVWICQCDCGNFVEVTGCALHSGMTQSCGCLQRELAAARATHGHNRTGKRTPEYRAWDHAKQRCTNPKHESWADYGGRGIKFLFSTFEDFFAEVGPKPTPYRNYVLDRIDNDKNYEVGNVRWVTYTISGVNQRMKANNTSGFRGVSKQRSRWAAEARKNGKRFRLGTFSTPEEAARVRDAKVIELYGSEAKLNFPWKTPVQVAA
jgi:hypothetical protein